MKSFKIFSIVMFCSLVHFSYGQSKPAIKPSVQKIKTVDPKPSGVKLTFDNEHLDIGKVKKGEIKKFDMAFTNTGTETIEIDIATGCDCTTLDYPRKPIKVGERGVIHIVFDSGKKEESETVDIDIYLKNLNPKTGPKNIKNR